MGYDRLHWLSLELAREDDPRRLLQRAGNLEATGDLEGAATAYDHAYGLDPAAPDVQEERGRLLDRLSVVEHGLRFRYIPCGLFRMGNDTGEEDERPSHWVVLSPYWMSEVPVSWASYCVLMDWEPPPAGHPRQFEAHSGPRDMTRFHLNEANKIRLQYCEDRTTRARDWHAHLPQQPLAGFLGKPPREDPDAPWQYATKPMVAVAWQEVHDLTGRLSRGPVTYALPTEAQWEKAARGGLVGSRHAWGNEPPDMNHCDFDHFRDFVIRPMTTYPPNGYGLYAINGGVWEWTSDWYDRDYYRHCPEVDPHGPAEGQEKVLRGGSWADCADVITVTFRMSRDSRSWKDSEWGPNLAPNIGFRLCRTVAG